MSEVVIAGYARTPFIKMNGAFSGVSAVNLGAHAITASLAQAGISPSEVDFVYGGQVLQAGAGQNPARQAAVAAGLPLSTPAMTLNAVCLSGLEAISAGVRLIQSGKSEIVVAVGQESMSQAPHAWVGSRSGKKYGPVTMIDTLEFDGLTDAFELRSMGESTESYISPLAISRVEQDFFAAQSHQKSFNSRAFISGEIAPYEVRTKSGSEFIGEDDGIRPGTTPEILATLRPAFGGAGTITAGNSSQLTDGAAAVVLMSAKAAQKAGVTGLAEIISTALVSGPDYSLHSQPSNAILSALRDAKLDATDLSAVEINEAFAAVGIQSTKNLNLDPSIVNMHGGAIALGHPIGASGARIVGHLARTLQMLGTGSQGAAGICGGGGQGSALILRAL